MAEKELNINVRAKADKTEVEDLAQSFDSLKQSSEEAQSSIDNFNTSVDSVDTSGFDDTASSAEDTASSVDNATESTENFNSTSQSVNGDGFGDVAGQAGNASEEIDNTTNSALNLVEAMASAAVASTITSGIGDMVNAAGSYEDTMVRLGYAMTGTSMTAEQAQQRFGNSISNLAKETGRGAGAIRQHIINLGNAGITNQKVLEDSFNGISKAAFQMGTDIGQADAVFQRMVISGSIRAPMLANAFGLSMRDLANAAGVAEEDISEAFKKMDSTTRASVLSTALNMKYGSDVTENYKNSYEHLTEEVDRAKDYLIRSVGEAVLPYVIPVMQTAADVINGVTKAFRGLPEPVQNFVGLLITGVGGVMGFAFALSSVLKFAQFLYSPIAKLAKLFGVDLDKALINAGKNLLNFAKTLANTVLNAIKTAIVHLTTLARTLAETVVSAVKSAVSWFLNLAKNVLLAGFNALKSAAMWVVEKAALVASELATKAVAAAQWLLNIAMNANPIMLIVTAIGLLIMALAYLYFNNEQVRAGIDALGQAFMYVGQLIYSYFVMQIQLLMLALQTLWSYISGLPQWLLQVMTQIVATIITNTAKWIEIIASIPGRVGAYLSSAINHAINFASQFVHRIVQSAIDAVNGFVRWISQLPQKLAQELNRMIQQALDFARRLPQIIASAAGNMVLGWTVSSGEHSPGFMYDAFEGELKEMTKAPVKFGSQIVTGVKNMASGMVSGFNPNLSSLQVNSNLNNVESNTGLIDSLKHLLSDLNKGDFNLTLNIDSVDKRERVNEIVKIIENEIYWNNTTAGRGV